MQVQYIEDKYPQVSSFVEQSKHRLITEQSEELLGCNMSDITAASAEDSFQSDCYKSEYSIIHDDSDMRMVQVTKVDSNSSPRKSFFFTKELGDQIDQEKQQWSEL